jgi:hypothetical protein
LASAQHAADGRAPEGGYLQGVRTSAEAAWRASQGQRGRPLQPATLPNERTRAGALGYSPAPSPHLPSHSSSPESRFDEEVLHDLPPPGDQGGDAPGSQQPYRRHPTAAQQASDGSFQRPASFYASGLADVPPPTAPRPAHAPPPLGRGAVGGGGAFGGVRIEPLSRGARLEGQLAGAQQRFEARQAQLQADRFEAGLLQRRAQEQAQGERSYGAYTT